MHEPSIMSTGEEMKRKSVDTDATPICMIRSSKIVIENSPLSVMSKVDQKESYSSYAISVVVV